MASQTTYDEWPDLPERGQFGTIEQTKGIWLRSSKDGSEIELFIDGGFVASWRSFEGEVPPQLLAMLDVVREQSIASALSKANVLEWLNRKIAR